MSTQYAALRARLAPWAAIAFVFLVIVAWFWNRGPGLDRDDYALYLMHAESLVEGRPYAETGYISTPLDAAPSMQPPGLPLLVAGTMIVAGGFEWRVVKAVMTILGLLAVLLPGLYFAATHGRAMGLAVTAFLTVAWAPIAAQPESDLGFTALIWAVLLVVDRSPSLTWPRVACAFLLASYAMLYRFVGAALVPALALFAWANVGGEPRHARRAWAPVVVWAAGGVAVLALGGLALVMSQIAFNAGYLLDQIPYRTLTYARAAIGAHLYPLPGNLLNDFYHVASLALAAVGFVAWARTEWRSLATWFLICSAALLGVVWAVSGRYLLPFFPLLVFGLLHGIQVTGARLRPSWPAGRARSLALGLGATIALAGLVPVLRQPRDGGYLYDLPETQGVFNFLGAQRQAVDVRVAFSQPRVLAWQTGIPAMVTLADASERAMPELDRLRITHVVLDRLGLAPEREHAMRQVIADHACRFRLAYENASFEVYEILSDCPAAT